MSRRVVSLLHRERAALRAADPVLEAHAYALAVEVNVVMVLTGAAVDHAVTGGEAVRPELAGEALPWSGGGTDLQGLVESGVEVYADGDALARRGLSPDDLIGGVRVADRDRVDELLADAEAVLHW